MKQINNYITEKLHLGKNSGQVKCTCHPKDWYELRAILEKRLAEDQDAYLNDIDVSAITDMSMLFYELNPHNIDISEWNVSNVEDMRGMFRECKNFNCNLSEWDVSKVKDMYHMFEYCTKFEGKGLEKWDVSNVTDMTCMFNECITFNCDLNNWDVSKAKYMSYMFDGCTSLKNKPSWYKS